jgi:hypothetical protein
MQGVRKYYRSPEGIIRERNWRLGLRVAFSNLWKVLFPKHGIRKAKLVDYYMMATPKMLGILHGRALSLKRYPDGVDSEGRLGIPSFKGLRLDKKGRGMHNGPDKT